MSKLADVAWALGFASIAGATSLCCQAPSTLTSSFPPEQVAATPVKYLEVDQGRGRSIDVRVDPRIELFSILAQLAGFEEYSAPLDYAYARAVASHFGPFRDHAAVKRMRSLRRWKNISYDAVLSLAVHVTDPPALAERFPFDPLPSSLDSRWTRTGARTLLDDAREFATVSDFFGFWRSQRATFEATEQRLGELLGPAPLLEWFDAFFGIGDGARFHGVPGMLTGSYNYGVTCQAPDQVFVYQVAGVNQADAAGVPTFSPDRIGSVIHEYAHAFVDPFVVGATSALRRSGQILFERMEPQMRAQAYDSWSQVMSESLVRAATVRYFQTNLSAERAAHEVERQYARGFLWVESLAALLGEYESERDVYSSLESFTPRLQAFFERYTSRIAETLEEWDSRLEYWRAADPIVTGALRREVVAQLNEVNRILDRTSFDLDLMRRSLDALSPERDIQVTILDASGDFIYHAAGLIGSAYHHRDVRGRSIYRSWNEGKLRAGVAFHIDAISGDRNAARVNVIAYERNVETGWLLCVEGHEWQRRSAETRP